MASRLEAIAEPGGVMVSPSVYEFAHKQLAVGFDFAGSRKVKDGEDPITAYRVRIGGSNQPAGEAEGVRSFAGMASAKPDREGPTAWEQMQERYEKFRVWFDAQDRKVRFSVTMIGFFFAINLLFSGIATPWFIFPSAPFLAYILLRGRKRDRRKTDSG